MGMPIYAKNAPIVHDDGGVFTLEFREGGDSIVIVLPRHAAFMTSETIRDLASKARDEVVPFSNGARS